MRTHQMQHEIVEVQKAFDERQVEGLIQLCKDMVGKNHVDKSALMFIPWDPMVVAEAKRRILKIE